MFSFTVCLFTFVYKYAYSTGHFVLHDILSTFMIIFFMLVDTLFTRTLKCRKYATQMKSSYGCEEGNDQSNRRTKSFIIRCFPNFICDYFH